MSPNNPNYENKYITLDPAHTDPARIKQEREKARKLRKSQWWLAKLSQGLCHYCGRRFPASQLTMDHVIPLARGGTSAPGNIVPACSACNRDKKLKTPVDSAFAELELERAKKPENRPKNREDES